MKGAAAPQGRQRLRDKEGSGGATIKGANFDGRHDNGDGRYTTETGGTTTRHDSGKGQQGDRMHDDFDGRHDDDKGQQGNRRRDNQQRRDDEGHGGATKKAEPAVQR
jgi:hypothetical protein